MPAEEGQPIGAAALIRPQLGGERRGKIHARDALELGQQWPDDLRDLRHVHPEIVCDVEQYRQRRTRGSASLGFGRHQVEQRLCMLLEEGHRQVSKAAAFERDDAEPLAVGARHIGHRGPTNHLLAEIPVFGLDLERYIELLAVGDDAGRKFTPFGGLAVGRRQRLLVSEALQTSGEDAGVTTVEANSAPRNQREFVAQTMGQTAFARLITRRRWGGQQDQAPGVDAGDRRITVNQQR